MESMTVTQVSKTLGISTRMLRYYEQEGLIESFRQQGYAYRVYEKDTVRRLRQILLLRKLRIPVRQIKIILETPAAVAAIQVFAQNIAELDEEITALSTIREILTRFVEKLSEASALPLDRLLEQDTGLLAAVESLRLISINFREEQTMENLQKADARLSQIKDVRILYLPPATVAAAHWQGEDPELYVGGLIDGFVRANGLHKRKPDLRRYGFNHPNPMDETGRHGYEAWVTIPEELEVPAPLVKKRFPGGLYAAHAIAFGNFQEWDAFLAWALQSERYEFAGDLRDQEHMCGLLEEHLNYFSHVELGNPEPADLQLDLLIPLRVK